jgi:hypothetical protein
MNYFMLRFVLPFWIGVFALFFLFNIFTSNRSVRYDCRDANWHPDYPIKVKEECAKLRPEKK